MIYQWLIQIIMVQFKWTKGFWVRAATSLINFLDELWLGSRSLLQLFYNAGISRETDRYQIKPDFHLSGLQWRTHTKTQTRKHTHTQTHTRTHTQVCSEAHTHTHKEKETHTHTHTHTHLQNEKNAQLEGPDLEMLLLVWPEACIWHFCWASVTRHRHESPPVTHATPTQREAPVADSVSAWGRDTSAHPTSNAQ